MTSPQSDPTAPNNPPNYDAAPTYSDAAYQDQVYQAPGQSAPNYADPTSAAPGYAPGFAPPPGYPPAAYPAGYPQQPAPGYPPQVAGGYPPPPPYGYTSTGYPAYNPAAQTNTMAILSLVMAFVFAPLAIVFGHMARKQIKQTGEAGDGLATAGLWCGYIFTSLEVLVCGAYALIIVFFATSGNFN